MNFSSYLLLVEVFLKQHGVARRNSFPLQIIGCIIFILVNSERQPAFSKSEFFQNFHLLTFFIQDIFPDNANISNSIFNILWNVIIPQEEYFQRKIIALGLQPVLYISQINAALF